jgi:hypothetical protein
MMLGTELHLQPPFWLVFCFFFNSVFFEPKFWIFFFSVVLGIELRVSYYLSHTSSPGLNFFFFFWWD